MKHSYKIIFALWAFAILMCGFSTSAYSQQELHLPKLFNFGNDSLTPDKKGNFNDCWGYVDSNGREYAITGNRKGTFFFDITDPVNSTLVAFFFGSDTIATHRDFKTYSHYAYGVCDQGTSSLQIFDLQYLPDSVVKVYDNDTFSVRCHNIFIANDKLFLASNTTQSGFHAMDVLSLANPESPVFISTLSHPSFWHVHDVYVRNDTAYCSSGYEGLFVFDYSNAASPVLIQVFSSYPENGYSHSNWVSEDGKMLVIADENHGKGLKLYDISDFSNPVLKSIFRSNLNNVPFPMSAEGSIPHNPYIRNGHVFVSYYHDGVVAFDINDPVNPFIAGYHDTYPPDTNYTDQGYAGCWGVYPFLPSGNVIASDITFGLFVLDGSFMLGLNNHAAVKGLKIFPNPAKDFFYVSESELTGVIAVSVTDILGKEILKKTSAGNELLKVDTSSLPAGIYIIHAETMKELKVSKLIISR